MEIKESELYDITGGAIKSAIWLVAGGIITVIIGIVDGFLRPLACNK